jgi:hypothetical protein
MSSRKAATAKTSVSRSAVVRPAAKPASKVVAKSAIKSAVESADKVTAAKATPNGTASAEATQLAAQIERGLRDGQLDTLTPKAFQTLMAALCKSYSAQLEAGGDFLPLATRESVSPTEIMTTTSALLKSANLAVFELGMWQSWTGR